MSCVGVGRRGWGIYIERRGRVVLDWFRRRKRAGHEVEGGGGRFEGKKKNGPFASFYQPPTKGVGTARAGFSLHG